MSLLRTALWPVALLAGLGAFALILTSEHEEAPLMTGVLTLLVGWSFALSTAGVRLPIVISQGANGRARPIGLYRRTSNVLRITSHGDRSTRR